MKPVERNLIRNIGTFGHGGEGKTSLAEAILFDTGENSRLGRVDDGSSIMDYEQEESLDPDVLVLDDAALVGIEDSVFVDGIAQIEDDFFSKSREGGKKGEKSSAHEMPHGKKS